MVAKEVAVVIEQVVVALVLVRVSVAVLEIRGAKPHMGAEMYQLPKIPERIKEHSTKGIDFFSLSGIQ